MKKVSKIFSIAMSFIIGLSAAQIPAIATTASKGSMTVNYIDVGQGDSELVQQGNQDMLIDTGTAESQLALLNYLGSRHVKEINYLVLTHPHADHIGGAAEVINKYRVDNVMMPNVTTNTSTFEGILKAITRKKLKITRPVLGSKFKIGSAQSVIYGPVNPESGDLNTYSIVLKVTFGKTRFLFTGDAQASNEAGMIAKGYDLSADVLKVGHHGSHTSTSAAFLKKVSPKYAVIEVGKGNDYGHPTKLILNRLAAAKVKVYRTDLQGNVIATSNGNAISFNKTSSANAVAATPIKETRSRGKATTGAKKTPANNQSQIVYWTPSGSCYHTNRNCRTLRRSKTVYRGTLKQAKAKGLRACKVCS